jgi:5-hydroxyisourate hydrolase-like protein (transthyretin family)
VRKRSLFVSISAIVLSAGLLPSQIIHICCNADDCDRRQVQPNLQLAETTHLFGTVVDPTGAPFRKSKVELRKWVSPTQQTLMKTVVTDETGHFDLGQIEKGQYRFLPASHRAFKQPERVSCPQTECLLDLTLQLNPTDVPEAVCPIR